RAYEARVSTRLNYFAQTAYVVIVPMCCYNQCNSLGRVDANLTKIFYRGNFSSFCITARINDDPLICPQVDSRVRTVRSRARPVARFSFNLPSDSSSQKPESSGGRWRPHVEYPVSSTWEAF